MNMRIRLHNPFNDKLGTNLVQIRIDGEIPLGEFCRRLVEQFPTLREYQTGEETAEFLNTIFFVARKGILLAANDIVGNEDELEIMPPLVGG
jgi:hypothetical protein